MFVSSILSCLPLVGLMVLWGGLSPVTARQLWLHGTTGISFYPFYLTDYIATFPVYIFPFLILAYRSIFRSKWRWLSALALSAYYFAFPVAPSWVLKIEANYTTIGYFHRLLKLISPWAFFEQIVFYFLFVVGLTVLLTWIEDAWKCLQKKQIDLELLLDLAIVSFFLFMVFSFHVWEKYLLPVLPLIILRLLLTSELVPFCLSRASKPLAQTEGND